MKTNTHPGDYERNQPIISQPVPLCVKCGGFMLHKFGDGLSCHACNGSEYVMVMEGTEAAQFRARLREQQDASPDTLADGLAAAGFGSAGPM